MSVGTKLGAIGSSLVGAAGIVLALHAARPSASPSSSDAGGYTGPTADEIAANAATAADAASHFVDPDPIQISAPFEVSNVTTQAFAQILPSPQSIVFQPGGTRAGNVYTTIAQVDQVAQTINGPFDLVCDTTYQTHCTLSGALTLSKWARWTCLTPPGTSFDWQISVGTTIVNPPAEVDCNVSSSATAPVTSTTNPFPLIINATVQAHSGGPIWSSTTAITVYATGALSALIGTSPVVQSSTSIAVYVGGNATRSGAFSAPIVNFDYTGPSTPAGVFGAGSAITYGNIPGNPNATDLIPNAQNQPPVMTWGSFDATGAAQSVLFPSYSGSVQLGYTIGVADVGSNSTSHGITIFVSDDAGGLTGILNPVTGQFGLSYTYAVNNESHLWTLVPYSIYVVNDAGTGFSNVWVAADALPGYSASADAGAGSDASITWAGDLAGSTSAAQYVASLSGNADHGGQIGVNAGTLTWAQNYSGGLSQSARTSDSTPFPMTITSQAPYSGATTNIIPGPVVLNVPSSNIDGGPHGFVEMADNGNVYVQFEGLESGGSFMAFAPDAAAEITQFPTTGNGRALELKGQDTSTPGAIAGYPAIYGGNSVGDGGIGGPVLLQTGTGSATNGQLVVDVGPSAYLQIQGNTTDFIALGDVPANMPTLGALRMATNGGSTVNPIMTVTTSNTPIINYNGGAMYFGGGLNSTIQGATSALLTTNSLADSLGITSVTQMETTGLSSWAINSTTSFAITNATSGGDIRFPPAGGGGAVRISNLAGDTTSSSPIQMGVSSAVSLAATITLSAAQYTNHVVQFSGTAPSSVQIVLPTIKGGATGYCEFLDFTQPTLTSLTSLTFYVGTTGGASVAATTPTAKGTYMWCYDGTTPRISLIPKG